MNELPPNNRLTPYDDSYGTCDRTCAKFLVYPDSIEPIEIGRRLKLEPTLMKARGEKLSVTSNGVAPRHFWMISSEEHVISKDLRRHLDWLLDQITPASQQILSLQLEPCVMRISCVWWSAVGHGGPALWPKHLLAIGRLNLELDFELSFYPD